MHGTSDIQNYQEHGNQDPKGIHVPLFSYPPLSLRMTGRQYSQAPAWLAGPDSSQAATWIMRVVQTFQGKFPKEFEAIFQDLGQRLLVGTPLGFSRKMEARIPPAAHQSAWTWSPRGPQHTEFCVGVCPRTEL